MKLWQKIFLSSLILIIAAVNIISVTLLSNNHRLLLEREQSHAINEHEYFAASFANAAVYERLRSDRLVLGGEDVAAIAGQAVSGGQPGSRSAIFSENGDILAENGFHELLPYLGEADFLSGIDPGGSDYLISILRPAGQQMMAVGSALTIEDSVYFVVTASDVSEIFAVKKQQTAFVRNVGIVSAGVISLILLITTILLLRPLNRMNTYTKAIAGGNYRIRIRKKGSQEFRELAENMNIMADSVQSNAARLEKIAEDRQTFIADLAHEMKTPLTSILGFGDLLRIKKNVTDSERIEYAGVIVEETKRLRALSGKLMELVALGGNEIEKRPVSVRKMIQETETALAPLLTKNEMSLVWSSEDIVISADEELFKSLLYNIIENAVKASARGQQIELDCSSDTRGTVITVTDHGIGLTPEEKAKVFEPFYMADKSRSRKAGGAGLGLALCVKIAELHGARLSIESAPGQGTAVFIVIS